MFSRIIIAVLLFFTIIPVIFAQDITQITAGNLYKREKVIVSDRISKRYKLDGFIFKEDSIRVYFNNNLIKDSLYTYDRILQEVEFKTIPEQKTEIKIVYFSYPFNLEREHFKNSLKDIFFLKDTVTQDLKVFNLKSRDYTKAKPLSLIKTGSLIRGFSIGTNQDLNIESGLRMQLEGEVAEGVFITGALTDQTTPLQPEGNTQSLKEIDKVFINMRSEKFTGTFGDFDIQYKGGELTNISRKLKGVTGGFNTKKSNFSFVAAVSEGMFFTNRFLGVEGNQGPYQLQGKNDEKNIIVLAGTEKVWINGERMTRGEDNDYTIDYATGQITFTRYRPITQDSRIEVDFEYSIQDLTKNVLALEGARTLGENGLIYISMFSETDRKDNPVNFTYKDEDLNKLNSAGDSTETAVRNGVFYQGSQKGNYSKTDSGGVSFFVYKGENKGEYDIKFSYVGEGKGDYVFESFGVYRYNGKGNGEYMPVIKLPVPQSRKFGSIKFDYNRKNLFNFSSELGLSRNDNNTFSQLDDDDNNGTAILLNIATDLPEQEFLIFDDFLFNIRGDYRFKGENFNPVGRMNVVEFNRKWDMYRNFGGNENIYQLKSVISPRKNTRITLGAGKLQKGDVFSSGRKSVNIYSKLGLIKNFNFKIEEVKSEDLIIDSKNNWLRRKGNLNLKLNMFESEIYYEGEKKTEMLGEKENYGFNFDDISAKLIFYSGKKFSIYSNIGFRKDERYKEAVLFEDSDSKTKGIGINYDNGKNLTSSFIWQRRDRKYNKRDQKISNNLTDFRMQYSPFNRGLNLKISYKTSNNRTPLKERIYLKVEEGRGDYVYDEKRGGYVPDKRGNLTLRTITTEKFKDIFRKSFSLFAEFNPSRFSNNTLLKKVEGRTFLRIEDKLKESDLNPLNMFKMENPVRSNLHFTQFFIYNNLEKGFKVSGKINYNRNINNEYLDRQEIRKLKENSLTLENYFKTNFRNRIEVSYKSESKEVVPFSDFNVDISGLKILQESFYRFKKIIELSLQNRFGTEKDRDSNLEVSYFSISPGINLYFLEKGRLRCEFEYFNVKTEPSREYIPYIMAEGRFPGDNYQVKSRFEYRITGNISINFYYNGEIRGGESKPYHTGRGELRAFF